LNPRLYEAQLEDQKLRKAQECHIEDGRNCKANKRAEKQQNEEKAKKSSNSQTQKLPLNQTPLTLSMQVLPLRHLSYFFSQPPD
jgi:hypothetical protein